MSGEARKPALVVQAVSFLFHMAASPAHSPDLTQYFLPTIWIMVITMMMAASTTEMAAPVSPHAALIEGALVEVRHQTHAVGVRQRLPVHHQVDEIEDLQNADRHHDDGEKRSWGSAWAE
ncbi:MAG: hypothetical protein ACLUIW_03480 [Dysosmobacter welbionis]